MTKKLQLDKRKLLAIGIATMALMVVVTVIILFFPQKTAPIDHFFKALQKGSVSELEKCIPPEVLEYMTQTYEADGKHEGRLEDDLAQLLQMTSLAFEADFGKKIGISYLVTDKREYDNQQLRALAERMEEKFHLDADGITEACEIILDTTIKGKDSKRTETGDLYIVYKYHEEWYLYIDPLSGIN